MCDEKQQEYLLTQALVILDSYFDTQKEGYYYVRSGYHYVEENEYGIPSIFIEVEVCVGKTFGFPYLLEAQAVYEELDDHISLELYNDKGECMRTVIKEKADMLLYNWNCPYEWVLGNWETM